MNNTLTGSVSFNNSTELSLVMISSATGIFSLGNNLTIQQISQNVFATGSSNKASVFNFNPSKVMATADKFIE